MDETLWKMRNVVLLFLLIQGSVAQWQDTNSTDAMPDPVIVAIEKATDNIRRDLAAELRAMFEELPSVVQVTPPPLPGRVADVKEGQQLVFAADEVLSEGSPSLTNPPIPPSANTPRPPQRPRLPAVPPAARSPPPLPDGPPAPASAPSERASP